MGSCWYGKTSLPTQLCALLNRPVIRSQHTASTEEAHITGQILAREGTTYFEPGLLSLAMKNGWVYLADEYDLHSRRFWGSTSQFWKANLS
ncbi:porphyrin biosynthetic protein [Klebsiella pneumoniae]|uniref:Porphyrin biosynthetic protein n=1 Tax=Klebsiella pneumoniae TaxID=573 RepID=A0A377TIR0_KLEPN|nr:porphyrin biosynthetic protein [Klebsiella pneumoniae]